MTKAWSSWEVNFISVIDVAKAASGYFYFFSPFLEHRVSTCVSSPEFTGVSTIHTISAYVGRIGLVISPKEVIIAS
jgi:hypothetical protein